VLSSSPARDMTLSCLVIVQGAQGRGNLSRPRHQDVPQLRHRVQVPGTPPHAPPSHLVSS
jgi:hypothetical protein